MRPSVSCTVSRTPASERWLRLNAGGEEQPSNAPHRTAQHSAPAARGHTAQRAPGARARRGAAPVHDHVAVAVLDAADDLLEKVTRLVLWQPALLHDVVKQLAALDILHDHVDVCGRLDDLVQPDDVRVHEEAQDLDLAPHCARWSVGWV